MPIPPSVFAKNFLVQAGKHAFAAYHIRKINHQMSQQRKWGPNIKQLKDQALTKYLKQWQAKTQTEKLDFMDQMQIKDQRVYNSAIFFTYQRRKKQKNQLKNLERLSQQDYQQRPQLVIFLLFNPKLDIQKAKKDITQSIEDQKKLRQQFHKQSVENFKSRKEKQIIAQKIFEKEGITKLTPEQIQLIGLDKREVAIEMEKAKRKEDSQRVENYQNNQNYGFIDPPKKDQDSDQQVYLAMSIPRKYKIKKNGKPVSVRTVLRRNSRRCKRRREENSQKYKSWEDGKIPKSCGHSPQYFKYLGQKRAHFKKTYDQLRKKFAQTRRIRVHSFLQRYYIQFRRQNGQICGFCKNQFTLSNITRHYGRIHLNELQKQLFRRALQDKKTCPWCFQTFGYQSQLENHLKVCPKAKAKFEEINQTRQFIQYLDDIEIKAPVVYNNLRNQIFWKYPLKASDKREKMVQKALSDLYTEPKLQTKKRGISVKKLFD